MKKKTIEFLMLISLCCALFLACSDDNNGPGTPGGGDDDEQLGEIKDTVFTSFSNVLTRLVLTNAPEGEDVVWQWSMESAPSEIYSLTAATSREAVFLAGLPGTYKLKVTATKGEESQTGNISVTVKKSIAEASPYIAKIYDFLPAVGQFTNDLPAYTEGDTREDIITKVEGYLVGKENGGMVSLGGFGGYIVFGFDHTVVNVKGKRDIRILGNAFGSNANPRPDAPFGGSCEPGIIVVSYDKNGNGLPDDEWYEIAGSAYQTAENEAWYPFFLEAGKDVRTIRNYEITYHRPVSEEVADEYIYWEDNQGNSGYKAKNMFHRQSYFPAWVNEDRLTFSGTRLPENGLDESGAGNYFVLYAFRYGYADNYPNTDDESAIDLAWAVDADGNPVELPGIDFVKVYCGVNQENGWLGECSTEVAGAVDLHVKGISIDTRK
ncbi:MULTISPECIES: hypothetical protein [Culturomica]|uniref:hypothetical protein n=1 Tax=Culturomica TaxID=1926651 RepID=UPI0008385935|nr:MULTISPECIES: hypothetical protein [Culturomica]HBO25490.1 hypothetical protein [Culturomica sp.]